MQNLVVDRIENNCSKLSTLTKKLIRQQILGINNPPLTYTLSEALVFWLGDLLLTTGIVNSEQLLFIFNQLKFDLHKFGEEFDTAIKNKQKLPICKIGFLDRTLVCMDGVNKFINLQTGELTPATDNKPVETLAYNLTSLCMKQLSRLSAEEKKDVTTQKSM